MSAIPPARRYYESLVGSWAGRFRLRITGGAALRRLSLGTQIMGTAAHLAGGMSMHTTLTGAERRFRHTTRVSAWGVTSFTTEEDIEVEDDGRHLKMSGVQRVALGANQPYESHGEIESSGMGATYRLTWMGGPLVQRTRITPEGLLLTQETDWSTAEVLLRRVDTPRLDGA